MGNILYARHILNVDADINYEDKTFSFSRNVFQKFEWDALKLFCNKHFIQQKQLVVVFHRYLSSNEATLRKFFVQTMDLKEIYLNKTKLMQELADIFIPLIFVKNFNGLEPIVNSEEISFARLVIHGYLFCNKQIPDLLFIFFCLLRRKFDLQLNAVILNYNFAMIVNLLTEDLQTSGSIHLIKKCILQPKNDSELTVESIIQLGIKYPLLFYSLERFRSIFKRSVFGDKFLKHHKLLKQSVKIERIPRSHIYKASYKNEASALQVTARAIIGDILSGNGEHDNGYQLNCIFNQTETEMLSEVDCNKLKIILGYKASKSLILESGLIVVHNPMFFDNYVHKHLFCNSEISDEEKEMEEVENNEIKNNKYSTENNIELVYDDEFERNFEFSIAKGYSCWKQRIYDANGLLLNTQDKKNRFISIA